MRWKKAFIPALVAYIVFMHACAYIVLPEGLETSGAVGKESIGWSAVVTGIEKSGSGDFHVDITIRNETGDWSAMSAAEGKPAVLSAGGKNTNCDTVFASTGGHRVAPGFQMRGYSTGTKSEPTTQLIYVECAGAEVAPGATLSIPYSYVTGQYNYYEPDKNKVDAKLEINLDEVVTDLTYPVAEPVDDLIREPDAEIVALNKVVLTLTDIQRVDNGLHIAWRTSNPGEYPTYVHIGNPPVIGEDGILYGYYETPDIVNVPITPAGANAEWTTEVAVPANAMDFHVLVSVESGKARLFANYAIKISGK